MTRSNVRVRLRSPLHGILASVELLQETGLSLNQNDLALTIDSCGKTLLDTINHVLDFSKVNRKQKDQFLKRARRNTKDGNRQASHGELVVDDDSEDISILTEEVVKSVYAGSASGKRLCRSKPGHERARSLLGPTVSLIVDTQWKLNWRFGVDGGALRRIIMNVTGNALKYTTSGFVRVVLRTEDDTLSRDGKTIQSAVSLTVTDSGKGISQEFLKTHLYTPFAQEDALSAGTGLGLSIVHQIVRDMNGSMNFTSEQGSGTEVRIILPLKSSAQPGPSVDEEKSSVMFSEVRAKTRNMTASLVAFDTLPDISETPTGILSPATQAKIYVKDAVSSMMGEWFGCELKTSSTLDITSADVHVIAEDVFSANSMYWANIEEYKKQPRRGRGRKIIMILCVTYPTELVLIDEDDLQVFYVQQP